MDDPAKKRERVSKEGERNLLQGLRILDLADEKASFCSKLLADMGADVIKVERPGGDPSRKVGPFIGDSFDPEKSLFFHYNNANKRGITLNIEHPIGRDIFLRLVKQTDIVVETFPPGFLRGLLLDYEVLKEANPKLILVSVTGFGQSGPRKDALSCDLVASAYGGQMYLSGSPSTPPLKPYGNQSYYTASLFAAIGIVLALRKREQTGEGEQVDISLQESVISTLNHVVVRYFYEKTITQRQGSLYGDYSFFILPCKNGYFLMAPFQQWETLLEWMESEGMDEDLKEEKWREEGYRMKNFNYLFEILKGWAKTHTVEELFEIGQLMRFPWAPIYPPEQVLENPQLKERRFFINMDHPEIGTSIKYPGSPYRLSSIPLPQWRRAPHVGEDNMEIYQKEMGFSDEELKRLSLLKVI